MALADPNGPGGGVSDEDEIFHLLREWFENVGDNGSEATLDGEWDLRELARFLVNPNR